MENILPLASRRNPESIGHYMEEEEVQALFDYFGQSLEQLFLHYADMSEQRRRKQLSKPGVQKPKPRRLMDDPVAEICYPEYFRFTQARDSNYTTTRQRYVRFTQVEGREGERANG